MADEAPTVAAPVEEPNTAAPSDEPEEPRIPRSRLNEESAKRKEAERQLAEMRARVEEIESAGLSEAEQAKKRAQQLEERLREAEKAAEERTAEAARVRAEQWISTAAATAGFEDPEDAVLRIKAGEIESPEDAERAVKRLLKNPKSQRFLKQEDPKLPGRVLENGRAPSKGNPPATGAIDVDAESRMLADALKGFANRWHTVD